MRWITAVPLWIVGAILVLQSPIQAQTADSPLPVSMDRIRRALTQEPPPLQLPASSDGGPTFRIEVRQRPFVLQPAEEKPFDPSFGLPSLGELLLDGIDKIRSAAHHRAERGARKEVEEALAAFCAVNECPTRHTDK